VHAQASLIFRAPLNLSALGVTHLKAVSGHAACGGDRRYPGALLFGFIAIRNAESPSRAGRPPAMTVK
jgi:hypothetical protein